MSMETQKHENIIKKQAGVTRNMSNLVVKCETKLKQDNASTALNNFEKGNHHGNSSNISLKTKNKNIKISIHVSIKDMRVITTINAYFQCCFEDSVGTSVSIAIKNLLYLLLVLLAKTITENSYFYYTIINALEIRRIASSFLFDKVYYYLLLPVLLFLSREL